MCLLRGVYFGYDAVNEVEKAISCYSPDIIMYPKLCLYSAELIYSGDCLMCFAKLI